MVKHNIALLGSILVGSLLAFASPAAATPPSTGGAGPEEEACTGRSSGDACTLPNKQLGTCAAATCNRLDYSGGSPPKAIEEACVVCKAPDASTGGPPILGGDGGAPPNEAGGEAGTDVQPSSTAATTEDKEPPETSSRCRVDDGAPSPAGLALLAGLLLIAWPRRSL
jgi:MYXO-CTERM domain-containing protein